MAGSRLVQALSLSFRFCKMGIIIVPASWAWVRKQRG